jgi:hypothetical protein
MDDETAQLLLRRENQKLSKRREDARKKAARDGFEVDPANALRVAPERDPDAPWLRLWLSLQSESESDLDIARHQCREMWEAHWTMKKNLSKHYSVKAENGLADDLEDDFE